MYPRKPWQTSESPTSNCIPHVQNDSSPRHLQVCTSPTHGSPLAPDAPPERMVHLRHPRVFATVGPSHPTLPRHLHIPIGASLISDSCFPSQESPLLDHLPERSPSFRNLVHITTIDLSFNLKGKFARLGGPSGSIYVLAGWERWEALPSYALGRNILCSLGKLSSITFVDARRKRCSDSGSMLRVVYRHSSKLPK